MEKNPLGDTFTASITIRGNANSRAELKHKLKSMGKWMSGGTREGSDIVFQPGRANRGTVQHPERLEDEDLDAFRHLIAIREWETPLRKEAPESSVNESSNPPLRRSPPQSQAPIRSPSPLRTVSPPLRPPPTDLPTDMTWSKPPVGYVPSQPMGNDKDRKQGSSESSSESSSGRCLESRKESRKESNHQLDYPRDPSFWREQLRLVREETRWTVRVIDLLEEGRRVSRMIRKME